MPDDKRYAAIYIRLSKWDGPADDSNSPLTQRRKAEAWCAANGYEVAAVYEDLDVSGGSTERPQLTVLRSRWRDYDAVVAASLDRISRSVRDFSELVNEARTAGCAVATVREGLDLGTPVGRFVATILAAFAEMELEMIRERTRAGQATAAAEGRWNGGPPPVGFRTVRTPGQGAKIEVDPAQQAAVREALLMRTNGASWRAISNYWLSVGLKPKRSDHWDPHSIQQAMTREKLRDLGVLTLAEYEEALRVFAPRYRRSDDPTKPHRWIASVLHCAGCGGAMGTSSSDQLRCYRMIKGLPCAAPVTISMSRAEAYLESEYLDMHGNRHESRVIPLADATAERRAQLQARIREISETLGTLADDQAEAAMRERRELRDELESLQTSARGVYTLVSTGRTLEEAWHAADNTGKRDMMRKALNGVKPTVHKAPYKGWRGDVAERITPRPLFPMDEPDDDPARSS